MNCTLEVVPSLASNIDYHQSFRLVRDALAGNREDTKTMQLSENDMIMKMTDKWSELEQT